MLYQKNNAETLTKELFEKPTCEYRCTPFWAWNSDLDPELLNREIDIMKEMGMGGFHMHSRTGMAVPYLTDEFMGRVRGCVEKAKKEEMLAWLYDEDRWPSGAAGGLVTKEYRYRAHRLCYSTNPFSSFGTMEEALASGVPCLIAVFDIVLNRDGTLSSYREIGKDDTAQGTKWYVSMLTAGNDSWYNGQSYIDTLSKEAVDRFIAITHERYAEAVGDEFGKIIPAIFTDEPQFSRKSTLNFPEDKGSVFLPWTYDLPQTFEKKYGDSLIPHLPELLWDLPDGEISVARYRYHDHVCDRFVEAFADNCGQWCEDHGISMTGHMVEEPSLCSQTSMIGEAMRSYRKFGLPGIDMLCNSRELTTAKQCQSAVHQYGREGMVSELYGVSDWDFDFRGHKFQGDWQAALGVTVRVPHLFWVSMHGEAKRDYPASIGYQSPWYKEYSYVEDHFARVNTALTRGKPVVKVGVIHPIESYWLHFGPRFTTEPIRDQMEKHFYALIEWLLGGTIDFDYISESLLPEQVGAIGSTLEVGKMEYDTILVPELETMRASTLAILKEFKAKGGKLIFIGNCPSRIDAVLSDEVKPLYEASLHTSFDKHAIMTALEDDRLVELRDWNCVRMEGYVYQMRQDTDGKWLFLAPLKQNKNRFVSRSNYVAVRVKGEYTPILYNTLNGKTEEVSYHTENGWTVIPCTLFSSDSLLFKLVPQTKPALQIPKITLNQIGCQIVRDKVRFERSEPNVLLLDFAEYRWDDKEDFVEADEIIHLDNEVRVQLGLPRRTGNVVQPWTREPEVPNHTLTLRFRIPSEIEAEGVSLAIEEAASMKIVLNGQEVAPIVTGYYTDESCQTVSLPKFKIGVNELLVTMPFGNRTETEWCYLLGNFNVRLEGCVKTLTAPSDEIAFQSVTTQGMPFYSGNLDYKIPVYVPETCHLVIKDGAYQGSAVAFSLDGERVGMAVYEPYTVMVKNVCPGWHMLTLHFFGNRFNSHGAVHNDNYEETWTGPGIWRTGDTTKEWLGQITISENSDGSDIYYRGDRWCEEYRVRDYGILTSPHIFFMK